MAEGEESPGTREPNKEHNAEVTPEPERVHGDLAKPPASGNTAAISWLRISAPPW